jgi:DNA-binding winged helix-turn-helix (wHTH) protein
MSVTNISFSRDLLVVGELVVPLTNQELKLINFLASFKGKVCTTAMLLDLLYRGKHAAGQKILDVFICKIKRKIREISPGAEEVIRKVWGRGYIWGYPEKVTSAIKPGILPDAERWVALRKAAVVAALKSKQVSELEVLAHYPDMTPAELHSWIELFILYGLNGLRATRTERYMDK